ncbi:MAG TPA: M23 family metallopeptidase [Labilithrix sp.]
MKRFVFLSAFVLAWPSVALAGGGFAYDPPGQLVDGSGKGRVDTNVYAPGIRYPMESGPAYANSQVWGHGGTSGPTNSDQCDAENFQYPWHDNYCETRDYSMPLCPAGTGHQGQDNRAADCKKDVHTTVAVVDGTITSIGSYSVYLTRDDGVRFDYLHMSNLLVNVGDKVKQGQAIGKVSNHFGTSTTTVHLHFNIFENVKGVGSVYVPPYTSLIEAYQTLMGLTTPDAGPPPPPAPTNDETPPAPPPPAPTADPPPSDDGGCAFATPHGATTLPTAALLALLVLAARRKR